MDNSARKQKSLWLYFLLVFVLAIPFWLLGSVAGQLLPKTFAKNLPVSALIAFCPMIAALILTYRDSGSDGAKQLLRRIFDYKRIRRKIWYIPIIFLMPAIFLLDYGVMRLLGIPIPGINFSVLLLPVVFALYFIPAIGEELGWTGYATDPMQEQWGALGGALILGIIWAAWHLISLIQTHNGPIWVAGQDIGTIALRVLIVWIYNNTGKSVFAAITLHTTVNVSEFLLFPDYTLPYAPVISAILMTITAAIVAFLWGPRTLAQYRYA